MTMFTLPGVLMPLFAPDEPPTGGAAPEPAPAAAPDPAAAEPAATADDPWDTGAAQFDRPYVTKLRNEAQNLRERFTPFRDTFEDMDPEDQQAWLYLAQEYKRDPQAAAAHFETVAKQLRGESEGPDPEGVPAVDPNAPLTRAEFEAWQAFQQQQGEQRQVQEQVQSVQQEAQKLGYTLNTPEYVELLWFAQNQTDDGSLAKAHELVQAKNQKVVDDYLAGKRQDARGGITPVAAGAPGAPVGEEIKDFAGARKSLLARLAAAAGQP